MTSADDAATATRVRERLLSCSRAEFAGWLAAHTNGAATLAGSNSTSVPLDGGAILVEIEERAPRRIALLTLPQLAVRFRYPAAIAAEAEAWLDRFALHTQRGGG